VLDGYDLNDCGADQIVFGMVQLEFQREFFRKKANKIIILVL